MSTKVLKKQEVGSWSENFPEKFATFNQSLIFMKRLLGISICQISYLRLIFPDEAYADKSLEGIKLKILRDDKKYPQASFIIDGLKGAFDALEKKYLKTLVFSVYSDVENPNIVLDSFSFHISYDTDTEMSIYNKKKEKVASLRAGEKTKGDTKMLLRRLVMLCSTLEPLPEVFSIGMKIYYYEDVTPSEYEPPGFGPSEFDDIFDGPSKLINIGEVDTPYHSCNLQLCVKEDDDDEVDNIPSFSNSLATTTAAAAAAVAATTYNADKNIKKENIKNSGGDVGGHDDDDDTSGEDPIVESLNVTSLNIASAKHNDPPINLSNYLTNHAINHLSSHASSERPSNDVRNPGKSAVESVVVSGGKATSKRSGQRSAKNRSTERSQDAENEDPQNKCKRRKSSVSIEVVNRLNSNVPHEGPQMNGRRKKATCHDN